GKEVGGNRQEQGHWQGRLRPRPLPLSRPRQGVGRRRARRWVAVLSWGSPERALRLRGSIMAREREREREPRADEPKDRVVKIRRCAAVVKGGRRFSFNALVVVGDGNGRVASRYGKANEVPPAVEKATKHAQ